MQKPKRNSSNPMEEKEVAVICKEITKVYSKTSSSIQERKRTWKLLLETLFRGKKHTKYKKTFSAVSDVSLKIKKGDSVGIIGLNGSGKSTLLQIIAGTLQPSSGEIHLNGKIGALLELGSGFNPEFTGRENIYLNAKILGLSKSEVDKKYDQITSFSGIGDFVNQPVRSYSSGMVVRLAFSVIAHTDPDILIIDEALAVGDARFQLKCFAFLQKFKKMGGTLILVSHDLNSIVQICTRVILLNKGELICEGDPNKVINEYSKFISNEDKKTIEGKMKFSEKNVLDFNDLTDHQSSSSEFSYGGEKASIEKIKITNSIGSETEILNSGELCHISFNVLAHKTIEEPIYAMTIKDIKGVQVYGQNTYFAKIDVEKLEANEICQITFVQKINLGVGEYFLSIGCTELEENELKVVHRRYDVLKFKVISSDGSFGVANCFSKISCQKYATSSKYEQSNTLQFISTGGEISLQKGETFNGKKNSNLFRDTPASDIENIINQIQNGKNWRKTIEEYYSKKNNWLFNIVSNPKRTKFVEEYIKPEGLNILDIGAGWGQFSIPLAKHNNVCALEPTPERMNFVKAVSNQERISNNMYYINDNYLNLKFQTKFDLILSIGVLEWVGTNSKNNYPEETQREFLSKIKNELSINGRVIIGIENRIGMKYLLGTNDDHIGIPNISTLDSKLAKVKYKQNYKRELKTITYTKREYEKMLIDSGFKKISFYAAYPDYKIPNNILNIDNDDSIKRLNDFIRESKFCNEHDGSNGEVLKINKDIESHYKTFADMNIAQYFCPSFYIIAE
jgi:ABC-type polysaccharide/polyol phosphate transport system ATPase subunit/2-polyprenyl-3-methyl-5-hydroxy-6-metoxy-1,4-benzoquinol methylase